MAFDLERFHTNSTSKTLGRVVLSYVSLDQMKTIERWIPSATGDREFTVKVLHHQLEFPAIEFHRFNELPDNEIAQLARDYSRNEFGRSLESSSESEVFPAFREACKTRFAYDFHAFHSAIDRFLLRQSIETKDLEKNLSLFANALREIQSSWQLRTEEIARAFTSFAELIKATERDLHSAFAFDLDYLVAGAISTIRDFGYHDIVGPDGQPLKKDSEERRRIIVDVTHTNEEILKLLRSNPELMRFLPPRRFEEMVGAMLTRQGYDVTLTPAVRDGGFDMYAAKHETLGTFLYLVECKRYAPPKKVGVEVVRALYGVVQNKNATAGIVVTSSFFTSGAKGFEQENTYRMHLCGYNELQRKLKLMR